VTLAATDHRVRTVGVRDVAAPGVSGARRSAARALRPRRAVACYFHSQSLLFVFPSASASYSKTAAIEFKRLSFGESL